MAYYTHYSIGVFNYALNCYGSTAHFPNYSYLFLKNYSSKTDLVVGSQNFNWMNFYFSRCKKSYCSKHQAEMLKTKPSQITLAPDLPMFWLHASNYKNFCFEWQRPSWYFCDQCYYFWTDICCHFQLNLINLCYSCPFFGRYLWSY